MEDEPLTPEQQAVVDKISAQMEIAVDSFLGASTKEHNEIMIKAVTETLMEALTIATEGDTTNIDFTVAKGEDEKVHVTPNNFYTALLCQCVHVPFKELDGKTEYLDVNNRVKYTWNNETKQLSGEKFTVEFTLTCSKEDAEVMEKAIKEVLNELNERKKNAGSKLGGE